MELIQRKSASRGLHPSWSLSKSTHRLKATSSTWRVLSEDALHPVYRGTWTMSASTQTTTITSPTRLVCAPCTFWESGQKTVVNTKSWQSTLSARQSVPLNLLWKVRFLWRASWDSFRTSCPVFFLTHLLLFLHRIKITRRRHAASLPAELFWKESGMICYVKCC